MAKVTLKTLGIEIDSDWLVELMNPGAVDSLVLETIRPSLFSGDKDIARFSLCAGVAIALSLKQGVPMSEIVRPIENLAKQKLEPGFVACGMGATTEMWKFGGEFYKESKKQGMSWCDEVQLTSKLGELQKMPEMEIGKVNVTVIDHSKWNSINVA